MPSLLNYSCCTYLIAGGGSLISRNSGQTPNFDERKMATPSVLSLTEILYGSDKKPPGTKAL